MPVKVEVSGLSKDELRHLIDGLNYAVAAAKLAKNDEACVVLKEVVVQVYAGLLILEHSIPNSSGATGLQVKEDNFDSDDPDNFLKRRNAKVKPMPLRSKKRKPTKYGG